MESAQKLFLVRPERQAEPDANLRSIVNYIASPNMLFSKVAEDYTVALLQAGLENLIEIWYWFDSLNIAHRIVFWGDNLEPVSALDAETYNPLAEDAYYWFPVVLYDAFIEKDLPGGDGALTKYSTTFWNSPRSHLNYLVEHGFSLHSDAKLLPETVAEIAANDDTEPGSSSPPGDNWEATLMLVEYANRIPAIPAPKAARLLGVTEKTIHNRCGKGLECIPRKGTTWVTKRSIKNFVEEHYHPTPACNLWDDIEAALKRNQTVAASMRQKQQDFLDRRKETGKSL